MEPGQRLHVQQNIGRLISLTCCNTALLKKLKESGVLTQKDVDLLEPSKYAQSERTGMLYEMLVNRATTFDAISEALTAVGQNESAKILDSYRQQVPNTGCFASKGTEKSTSNLNRNLSVASTSVDRSTRSKNPGKRASVEDKNGDPTVRKQGRQGDTVTGSGVRTTPEEILVKKNVLSLASTLDQTRGNESPTPATASDLRKGAVDPTSTIVSQHVSQQGQPQITVQQPSGSNISVPNDGTQIIVGTSESVRSEGTGAKRELYFHSYDVLKRMLENKIATDCKIICNDKKVLDCHFAVLANCVPFFRDMLENKEKSSCNFQNGCLDMRNIPEASSESVEALLRYIYLGETLRISKSVKLALNMTLMAHHLEFTSLEEACLEVLSSAHLEQIMLFRKELFDFFDSVRQWNQDDPFKIKLTEKFRPVLLKVVDFLLPPISNGSSSSN